MYWGNVLESYDIILKKKYLTPMNHAKYVLTLKDSFFSSSYY